MPHAVSVPHVLMFIVTNFRVVQVNHIETLEKYRNHVYRDGYFIQFRQMRASQ